MAETARERDRLRVIRDGVLDVVRALWSVIAPLIVWWAGCCSGARSRAVGVPPRCSPSFSPSRAWSSSARFRGFPG